MDLKQLRTFIMVAQTGSLSKASDRLRLAQPALSRQIKLLEAEIGFALFGRSGRGMVITEAGQELLARISGLVTQLDKSIDDVRALDSRPAGRVALGINPSVSYVLAGRVALRVARELPNVSLRIVEGYTGHLIDWLQRGDVDLALMYGSASDLHLRVTELLLEDLFLVAPSDADLPAGDIGVKQLEGMKLVLPSRPHGLRMVVEAACAKVQVVPQVTFEADSFRVIKELVMAELGYTILPLSAFYREQAVAGFKVCRLVRPKVTRKIVMALPVGRTDTRATTAVSRLVLDEIRVLIQSGEWQAYPCQDFKLALQPGEPVR